VWPEDDEWDTHFIISVDGVHCRFHEVKHPTLSKDPAMFSHKYNGPGLAYELALHVYENRLVWMNGPKKPKNDDYGIYKSALRKKIPPGKKAITDRGYKSNTDPTLAKPNSHDDPELRTFKARARMRQEQFNARIKRFACLSGSFRHSIARHGNCFEAVCVLCVYEMELVSPMYSV